MKKTAILAAALSALLILAGCAGGKQTEAPAEQPQTAQTVQEQPKASESPAAEEPPAPTWHYEVKTTTAADKYEDGGVLFASIDYDFPELVPVCDSGDKSAEPPQEVKAISDAFYEGSWGYILGLEDVRELGSAARQQYNEMGEEYRQYFTAYWGTTEVSRTYERGDLLDVSIFHSAYWGGAHGSADEKNLHFDLKTGEFFELNDLSDTPEELRGMIAEDIIDGIYDRGEEDWYFDGFAQTVREHESYNVSFGEDGVSVVFDEYDIAPYAAGMPEFTVPYEKLARFLNERGKRLLDLPLETGILGDYYDALEMWYWFEGSAPFDYSDMREGTITNEYGTYEMPYLRVDIPGIETMADLRAKLLTRFSADLVEERLGGTNLAMFQEFDGRLYGAAAGRGTDWTVESVDYEVELNDAKDGGQIIANVHRRDQNPETEEWYSTGEADRIPIPFTLGENGAVFTWFPTIW